jgi:hypothetical protein
MVEIWRPIAGFESRYEVSNLGRVRSVPRRLRYTHWRTRAELFRQVPGKVIAAQPMNSDYLIVHLHADGERTALLVHRLVAAAFLEGSGEEVNHENGIKTDNRADNLEWQSSTGNKLHAVAAGLNSQAVPVTDPLTGEQYPSIAQAARGARVSHRTVRATFVQGGGNA